MKEIQGDATVPVGSEADTRRSGDWWLRLTSSGEKIRLYAIESYFRESWLDACDILGEDKFQVLQTVAAVMFKPEAVVSRRIRPAIELLMGRGFIPVMALRLRLNRHTSREMWRYQWDAATLDRLALSDQLTTATDSLWVVLRDAAPSIEVPASVRLAGLKGSPQVHERKPEDLRSRLGSPNRMLTFLHVADEPADTVRELGILFSRPDRRRILAEFGELYAEDGTHAVLTAAAELESRHPLVEFDFAAARKRLREALGEGEDGARAGTVSWLRRQLDRAEGGGPVPWVAFLDALETVGTGADLWDLILFGSESIVHDEEDRSCTLDGDTCTEGWWKGEGVLVL